MLFSDFLNGSGIALNSYCIKKGVPRNFVTKRLQTGFCKLSQAVNAACYLPEAIFSMINSIHTRNYSQQYLGGAYIGSSLFAADVLLPGLQGHSVCRTALSVLSYSNNPPWNLPLI